MPDVLLTHSYFLHFDPKEYRALMPYPPLGTLYAAGYLRSRGISVALHDVLLAKHEEEIIPAIARHHPKVVVIYDDCFNYLTKMCLSRMRDAAFTMTRFAKQHGCKVVIFSSDATDHIDQYLAHGADYIICGEAEITLAELMDHLVRNSNSALERINGLAFRNNDLTCRTGRRSVLEDLDVLPFPAWDLVNFDQYQKAWKQRHGYFSLNMVTTRGCPFHCNWCAKPIYGQVYHSRSPENVVKEMLFLKELAQPDHIWFADDIFGLKPGWVTEFAKMVDHTQAKIPFKCLSRADLLLKEDNIRHLKTAGCHTVWIGAESGSQKVLDAMEKGTTIEQVHMATSLLHRSAVRVGFFLQFGYPGETKQDIESTLQMVKDCKPDEIGISVSYPLPGTKFYERVKGQLRGKQNWIDSQDLDLMFSGEYSPDFYRTLHRVVHKKFIVWTGGRTAREILTRTTTINRKSIRSVASMIYHGMTLPWDLRRLNLQEKMSPIHKNN